MTFDTKLEILALEHCPNCGKPSYHTDLLCSNCEWKLYEKENTHPIFRNTVFILDDINARKNILENRKQKRIKLVTKNGLEKCNECDGYGKTHYAIGDDLTPSECKKCIGVGLI